VSNDRKFNGWTRSWVSFKEISRHLAGATKGNREEHQGSRWCGRDSSLVLSECSSSVTASSVLPSLSCLVIWKLLFLWDRRREAMFGLTYIDLLFCWVWVTLTRYFKLETYSCFILCLLLTETVRACVCVCGPPPTPVLFTCFVNTSLPWTRTLDYKNRKHMFSSNLKCKHLDCKCACACSQVAQCLVITDVTSEVKRSATPSFLLIGIFLQSRPRPLPDILSSSLFCRIKETISTDSKTGNVRIT